MLLESTEVYKRVVKKFLGGTPEISSPPSLQQRKPGRVKPTIPQQTDRSNDAW